MFDERCNHIPWTRIYVCLF